MAASREIIAARVSHVLSPDSGALGLGIRYAAVGGLVGLVYLTTTTVLAEVLATPFQIALAIANVTAIAVHFMLQRTVVWVHHARFALGVRSQAGRYLLLIAFQYALTAASTSLLPRALDVPVMPIYIVTVLMLAVPNVLFLRAKIFHPEG